MNKKVGGKQFWLYNGWFNYKDVQITYLMTFFNKKREIT